jgi:uncharacterized protein (DUF849 family)
LSVPVIINAALTGMVPTKAENRAVPVTPDEIAADAEACVESGAAIVHLHARDEDGRPTWKPDVYRRIVAAVRERVPDVVVCVSTSGRVFNELDRRAAVLDLEGDEKPELASLTLGSLNFPQQASINDPQTIRALAERMRERGIVPELEVFDLGMVDYARFLIERGVLEPPYYINDLLGSLGTLSATPFHLATVVQSLPEGAVWSGAGIGRFQFAVNAMSITMGGHARAGLEDNLWLDVAKTKPATNPELVGRVARVAAAVERPVASPDDARKLIGLPQPAQLPAERLPT